MIDPNEFVEVAEHILNTIVTIYGEHGVDLPARRYLAVGGQGETVHDCEQVTVSFDQGYSGLPGNQAFEPVRCSSPRTGVFVVEVVRSIGTPNTAAAAPDTMIPNRLAQVTTGVGVLPADVLTEIAKKQMVDAMLLMEAGLRAGETTYTGSITDISAGSPQGAYQAMIMTVTTSAVSGMQ
jgi:hypothetical protein